MAFESASVNAIWLIGDQQTPVRLATTQTGVLADPVVSPTNGDEAVYVAITLSPAPGSAVIYLLDLANDTKTEILTLGKSTNPEPYWHPNGTQIVYRKETGSPATSDQVWEIRRVDRDGTNDTLLHSYTPPAGAFSYALTCPAYSPSGNYICFGKGLALSADDQLWVMNADGSNAQVVATALGDGTASLQWSSPYSHPSWQHSADVIGWCELGADTTESVWWRKVNADGTGLTTLLDTPHVSGKLQWGPSGRFCWLPDDSAMVGFRKEAIADPRWRLRKIMADGSGDAAIGTHYSYAYFNNNTYGGEEYAPQIYRSRPERIYWTPGDSGGALANQDVVSVLPDGSDLRTDDDGTVTPAHGYWSFTDIAD